MQPSSIWLQCNLQRLTYSKSKRVIAIEEQHFAYSSTTGKTTTKKNKNSSCSTYVYCANIYVRTYRVSHLDGSQKAKSKLVVRICYSTSQTDRQTDPISKPSLLDLQVGSYRCKCMERRRRADITTICPLTDQGKGLVGAYRHREQYLWSLPMRPSVRSLGRKQHSSSAYTDRDKQLGYGQLLQEE